MRRRRSWGGAPRSTGAPTAPAAGAPGMVGVLAALEEPVAVRRLLGLVAISGVLSIGGFAALFFAYGETVAGWSTAGYAVPILLVWLLYVTGRLVGRFVAAIAVTSAVAAANHLVVHLALGGYAHSGGYLFWGVAVTLTAGLALTRAATALLALGYCAVAVALALVEPALAGLRPAPATTLTTVLFATVLIGTFFMVVPMFGYFLDRLAAERTRSEHLLLSILPRQVARRLKTGPGMIADRHDACSVVFADLVDFTAHSRGKDPAQIVGELNTIFSCFDALVVEHGAEKIKTIGDGYMAACGLPDPDPDHVAHACDLGLAMVAAMPALNSALGTRLQLRAGVHTGSAVAGVVGASKFSYDVWGETVNVASRLESNGLPDAVVTSAAVVAALGSRYTVERLGAKDLKGEGEVQMFVVTGRRDTLRP